MEITGKIIVALPEQSGVSKAGSIITDRVKKYYDEKSFNSCLDAHFELATLGNDAGIYGCVRMVLE